MIETLLDEEMTEHLGYCNHETTAKDTANSRNGTGGDGAKFWMSVLTDIKNRGVKDSFFLVSAGLKGLP